jgi:ADP-ribose pyrophosphatase YjhB (NUDIX family)
MGNENKSLKWIEWTRKLQAIAQNGITYTKDKYDLERYHQLQHIAAEIAAEYTDHDFQRIKNYLGSQTGYATPKVDVRGVVLQADKILLVREEADNLWTLPGGWADIHQSPGENVEREVYEESGYHVKAVRLLAVYDRNRHGHIPAYPEYVYKMFFLCKITGGGPKPGPETSEVGFFEPGNLPDLSVARVTARQIMRMAELKNSDKTDFD